MRCSVSSLALSLLLAARVHAETPTPKTDAGTNQPDREAAAPSRVLPVAAAVVPGVVVHGTGHFAAGESATARRLLIMEGVGLGMFLGGGVTIAVTGASRYFVAPAASVTMLGFGLFSTSYLADIYGTAAVDGNAALSRPVPPARWESELGYRRIDDPQFAYRDFLVERVSRQIGPLRLSPSGWFSLQGDSARYRAEAQYRAAGNYSEPHPSDISHLDVTFAVTHQRHHPEHFTQSTVELSLDGRYDLARLGRTLRGSFIELGAGYALGRIDYNLTSVTVPHDLEHVLLGRIGFGITLRGLSQPGSEFLAYYDHRHDDYAAGLKLPGRGSGIAGHFGLATRWFFTDHTGVLLDAQVGSAYIAGASLLFRSAPPARLGARP